MLEKIINSENCTIIDVRTEEEFQSGHVASAINIPLQNIQTEIEKIKSIKGPLVLCCASGGRSFSALQFLKSAGLQDVYDGGSWMNVNQIKN